MKNKERKLLVVILMLTILVIGLSIILVFNQEGRLTFRRQIIKEMTETEYESQITELNKSHENYATQVQANKQKLATAITNKGVNTSEDDTIDTIIDNIGKIENMTSSCIAMCIGRNYSKSPYYREDYVSYSEYNDNYCTFDQTTGEIQIKSDCSLKYLICVHGGKNDTLQTLTLYKNEETIASASGAAIAGVYVKTGDVEANANDIFKWTPANNVGYDGTYHVILFLK